MCVSVRGEGGECGECGGREVSEDIRVGEG